LSEEPCKVLVVDPERQAADSSVTLLELWGHQAEAAYSAEDAVAKAKTLDPDVILLDVGIAFSNGVDLSNELRQSCPAAKFVALTGFTQDDIVRRSRNAGFAKVLFKPTPVRNLKEAVESQCDAASGTQTPA
jgi:CheY-like chemotaxis protein